MKQMNEPYVKSQDSLHIMKLYGYARHEVYISIIITIKASHTSDKYAISLKTSVRGLARVTGRIRLCNLRIV